jgi:DTW domain-containing protein YfiP
MLPDPVPEANFRSVCYRCHKPQVVCICSRIQPVNNRTTVLVLQHPRERLHPIGTARFASLGLLNSRVEVAWNAGVREDDPPAWLPPGAALLYPAKAARDLRETPERERPLHLVVIDGTWNTARTLYRDKRWLHALPQYRFVPSSPGRYRLRREPELDYVSTIEAVVEALRILEPETQGLAGLLHAFDSMIDDQVAFIASNVGPRRTRHKRRPEAERRMPHALVEGFERLVVVYGESSRPKHSSDRQFVYFSALALANNATFERLLLPPTGLPDDEHLAHMGLSKSDFAGAQPGTSWLDEWAHFLEGCGPRPLIAAWNQSTLDLLAQTTGTEPSRISLKSAYRAVHGIDAHSLDEIITKRALPLAPNPFRGRAMRRLAGAVAIARFLNARATKRGS